MPNVPIPIELDRTRHLFFDFNALTMASKSVGVPMADFLSSLTTGLKLENVRELLMAGLYHEDKTLTVEKVGTLLDPFLKKPGEFAILIKALSSAVISAFSDETGEAEKKEPGQVPTAMVPKGRGRGKSS
jgi:hypothetical protein